MVNSIENAFAKLVVCAIIGNNMEEKMQMKQMLLKVIGRNNYVKLRNVKDNLRVKIKRRTWRKKYRADLKKYREINTREQFTATKEWQHIILGEWEESAGGLGCYFWQDLWAAKKVADKNPQKHYDIGSSLRGFIGHLSSFRDNIVLIDVRPMDKEIPGVTFIQGDAKKLSNIADDSLESLSSLCALEHFGLGRYGDEIDPEGCFKALKEYQRVVAHGGNLYLSVPIGYEMLQFNAHRIFYPETIINELSEMELMEFSTTGSEDCILYNEDIHKYDLVKTGGSRFGLFHFVKK